MDIKSNNKPKRVYVPVIPSGVIVFLIVTIDTFGIAYLIWDFIIGGFDTTLWGIGSKVGIVVISLIASGISTSLYLEGAEKKLKKLNRNDWS